MSNQDPPSDATQFEEPDSPPSPTEPSTGDSWRRLARRLLICNPFFLCSAALLLFGLNRLSTDDRLFASDLQNLFFNFFSLQIYEVALVGAALILARRRTWYDSSLLVVLENGLILVPFMLISQATMENRAVAAGLVAVGGLFAVSRWLSIRRWYAQFNLPGRALSCGVAIVTLNVALPLIFRPWMEKDVADWAGPNDFIWMFVLPLVALGANLLPSPNRYDRRPPERSWLPLFIYGLWTAGTGVHVWCVAHICSLPLEWAQVAPVLSIAAWTFNHRLRDCVRVPSARLQGIALALTGPVPLLAWGRPELFLLLGTIHLIAYLVLIVHRTSQPEIRAVATQLALATISMLLAGAPVEWLRDLRPARQFVLDRERLAAAALFLYLALQTARSRHPLAGLGCGLAVLFGGHLAAGRGYTGSHHLVTQVAVALAVLHSLRWIDPGRLLVRSLRVVLLAAWWGESTVWTHSAGRFDLTAGLAGLIVLAVWLVLWRMAGRCPSRLIGSGASAVLTIGPGHWCLLHGSGGLFSLGGSIALFVLGIILAWSRHRWDGTDKGTDHQSPTS